MSTSIRPPTIFHEHWWLDIVSQGSFREAVATRDGRIIATLPYFEKKPLGFSMLGMPPLTLSLGPAINQSFDSDQYAKSFKKIAIIKELIDDLPSSNNVSFRLHAGTADTLAFAARGFETSVEYTVEIEPGPVDVLWKQLRDKTRNLIRRAGEALTARAVSPAEFMLSFDASLRASARRSAYDLEILTRLVETAVARGRGRAMCCFDSAGAVHGAIFTVWDERYEYYLVSARPDHGANGAINLLLWEAITSAASHGRTFDMAMIHEDPELSNLLLTTGYGGRVCPRYRVRKASALVSCVKAMRRTFPGRKMEAPAQANAAAVPKAARLQQTRPSAPILSAGAALIGRAPPKEA